MAMGENARSLARSQAQSRRLYKSTQMHALALTTLNLLEKTYSIVSSDKDISLAGRMEFEVPDFEMPN